MPNEAPDEYSCPCGTPYICSVDANTLAKIKKSKCGIREFDNHYPGDGGSDGWISLKGGGHAKK